MNYNNEKWVSIQMTDVIGHDKIFVSDHGRIKSFKTDPEGKFLKFSDTRGYYMITFRHKDGTRKSYYVHKLVAEHFMSAPEEGQTILLHIDYNKLNNHVRNLRWVTQLEKIHHQRYNLKWIKGKEKVIVANAKLNESKVRLIKKKLADPNRKTRLKMIAKQFGISEMQLYRIKSGENWGHVTID